VVNAAPAVGAGAGEETSADDGDSERAVHSSRSVDGARHGILADR
jgi:hypothetical protein